MINHADFRQNFIFVPYLMKFFRIGQNSFLNNIVSQYEVECVFTVFGLSYWKPKVFHVCGYAIPHYIYNESPYFTTLNIKEKIRLFLLKLIQIWFFKRNANNLVFETEDARKKFCKKYKYKIRNTHVVSNTLNQLFYDPSRWKKNKKYEFKTAIKFLCLSANYKHKNLEIIPKVIDILIGLELKDFKFIISQTKKQLSFNERYDKYIEYLGYVELEELPILYKSVDILFMPTLLEIFSATYLESMFMGVPIVTSDLSFAHDICNDSALYVDPMDPKDCAIKLQNIANSKLLKEELIRKGKLNLKRFGQSEDRTDNYLKLITK
jgi:glycosyltransferase involved in cell wall biosynthesis